MNATQNVATNAAASANSADHQVGDESDRALVRRLLDNVGEVLLGKPEAIRMAVKRDPMSNYLPSTKGVL